MTPSPVISLLFRLSALDVKLWVDAGKLRIDAPRGVVDESLKAELASAKPALIEALSSPPWRPRVSPARRIVATWSVPARQRWGDLANQLQEEGWPWPDDETEAYRRLAGKEPE